MLRKHSFIQSGKTHTAHVILPITGYPEDTSFWSVSSLGNKWFQESNFLLQEEQNPNHSFFFSLTLTFGSSVAVCEEVIELNTKQQANRAHEVV